MQRNDAQRRCHASLAAAAAAAAAAELGVFWLPKLTSAFAFDCRLRLCRYRGQRS